MLTRLLRLTRLIRLTARLTRLTRLTKLTRLTRLTSSLTNDSPGTGSGASCGVKETVLYNQDNWNWSVCLAESGVG